MAKGEAPLRQLELSGPGSRSACKTGITRNCVREKVTNDIVATCLRGDPGGSHRGDVAHTWQAKGK